MPEKKKKRAGFGRADNTITPCKKKNPATGEVSSRNQHPSVGTWAPKHPKSWGAEKETTGIKKHQRRFLEGGYTTKGFKTTRA